jgi:Tfp pilus assembly protein PilO
MKHATQRLISFAIAVIVIVASLFIFFNLVEPAYGDAQTMKAEKFSKENFYANQQAIAKQVQATVSAYQGAGSPQALASLALPATKDEADLVNQVNVLAARYQIAVQNLTIATPGAKSVQGKQATAKAATSTLVKPVGVLTLQIRAAGSYSAFKSFLQSLESNIRIMDIGSVNVSPVGKPNQDYYTFDISASSYYQNP